MKNKISINLEVSLVEIIFSILIFATAGAIMLYCFAAARFTQIKANDKVEAGSIVQSNAEMIKSFDNSNDMNEYLLNTFEFNATNKDENIFINYYDKAWNLCDEESKEYLIAVKISDVSYPYGEMKYINIKSEKVKPYPFIDKNKKEAQNVIFEINTQKFFPSLEGRW